MGGVRAWLLAIGASLVFGGCDRLSGILYPANEQATRDNLENLRSQISNFIPAHGGKPPEHLLDAFPTLPAAQPGHHFRNDKVVEVCTDGKDASQLPDTGGWAYCANPNNPNVGTLVVDCTHEDSKGKRWYSY